MQKQTNIRLGISAINWANEDMPELGDHYTFEDITSEMASLGYEGTEMSRKFPEDPAVLKKDLAEKGMVLTSQWKSVHFSDPSKREEELAAYRKHVEFLKAMDCQYVVTCEIGGSFHFHADSTEAIPLTDEQWKHMVDGLEEAGRICKENGMKLVYHHHAGTVVEKPREIDRLMATTDPNLVHLLYDTGHAFYGGYNPLELLRNHFDRIPYVHLKDVRKETLEHVRQEQMGFLPAVRQNIFTVPGDGCIDFEPILEELADRGYVGWAIVEAEQDPSLKNPYEYAKKAKAYLNGIL